MSAMDQDWWEMRGREEVVNSSFRPLQPEYSSGMRAADEMQAAMTTEEEDDGRQIERLAADSTRAVRDT